MSPAIHDKIQQNLGHFLAIAKRRWKILLIAFLVIAIPATAVSLRKPTYYKATTKILLEHNRRISMELSTNLSERASRFSAPLERLNSQLEVIKSTNLIRDLVIKLELANTEKREIEEIKRLQSEIEVRIIPVSSIIEINYQDHDPIKAKMVVNTLAEIYQNHYMKLVEGDEALSFYTQHVETINTKLKENSAKLYKLQVKTGIFTDIGVHQEKIYNRLNAAMDQLPITKNEINRLELQIDGLEKELSKEEQYAQTGRELITNPMIVTMQEQQSLLEMEKLALLTKYTEKSREVGDKNKEIMMVLEKIAELPAIIEGKSVLAINPIYEKLESEIFDARIARAHAKTLHTQLISDIDNYKAKLAELELLEPEFFTLENAVAVNEKMYRFYLGKIDDARFIDSLNQKQITAMNIIQQAEVATPLKLQGTKSFSIIALLSLALSMAVVFVLESMSPKLDTTEQVRDYLNVPVLANLSQKNA